MADKKRKLPASVWVAFLETLYGTTALLAMGHTRQQAKERAILRVTAMQACRVRVARYLLAPSKGKRR